jgi:hypothetical protein
VDVDEEGVRGRVLERVSLESRPNSAEPGLVSTELDKGQAGESIWLSDEAGLILGCLERKLPPCGVVKGRLSPHDKLGKSWRAPGCDG